MVLKSTVDCASTAKWKSQVFPRIVYASAILIYPVLSTISQERRSSFNVMLSSHFLEVNLRLHWKRVVQLFFPKKYIHSKRFSICTSLGMHLKCTLIYTQGSTTKNKLAFAVNFKIEC